MCSSHCEYENWINFTYGITFASFIFYVKRILESLFQNKNVIWKSFNYQQCLSKGQSNTVNSQFPIHDIQYLSLKYTKTDNNFSQY